jgi:alpha-amylase
MPAWRLEGTFICRTLLFLGILSVCQAANSTEWSTRTVYQVLTDRFASPTNSSCPFVPPFSLPLNVYCGGTWAALTSRLDYIHGMGFDAIWISPIVDQIQFDVSAGSQGVIQSYVAGHCR